MNAFTTWFSTSTLLLTFLLCTGGLAHLQAQDQGDIKFGVQASPTFSWMSTNNNLIDGDGSNLGLKLGILGDYYFTDQYSLHTGLGFHFNAGGLLNYDEEFSRVDIWQESIDDVLPGGTARDTSSGQGYKYSLQYLEIPIGLTLRTREFGFIKYYVRPSLHLGILTQSRGELRGNDRISEDERFNISSSVNALNLSWSIGAGAEYAISESTSLVGGLSFQSGFADVTTDSGTSISRPGRQPGRDESKGRVNALVVTLGVMF